MTELREELSVSTLETEEKRSNSLRIFWKNFSKSKASLAALAFIIVISFLTTFAHDLPLQNPNTPNIALSLQSPSYSHIFGTDSLGRDVFSRFIYGASTPLLIGLLSGLIMTVFGVGVGVVAGYEGKLVDNGLMRLTDVFLIIPGLPLIIVIALFFGGSIISISFIIAILSWPPLARIIRAETLSLAKRDFISAERTLGASRLRILFVHIIPNELSPIMVYLALGIAGAILLDSAINFLGLGPIGLSWGFDVSTALSYWVSGAWWLTIFPGLGITLSSLSFFVLADGLNSAFNPQSNKMK
jgi:peptide/nickel transport system permease protein